MDLAPFEGKRTLKLETAAVRGLPGQLVGKTVTIPDFVNCSHPDVSGLGLPRWSEEQLLKEARDMREISSDRTVSVRDPDNGGVSADVRMTHYIDARVEDILEYYAGTAPDREALVDVTAGRRYTYGRLGLLAGRFGEALCRLGLPAGGHAAVVLPTGAANFISKFGIVKAGATIVNINFMERPAAILNMARNSDAGILVMPVGIKGTELIDTLYGTCPEMRSAGDGELSLPALPKLKRVIICGSAEHYPGTLSFEDILEDARYDGFPETASRSADKSCADVCSIVHTSGTTATPKGTMLCHKSMTEVFCVQAGMLGLNEKSRTCLSLPLFHLFGSAGTSLPTFAAGGCVVCMDRPAPEQIAEVLAEEKCTVLCNVPSMYMRLLECIHEMKIPKERFCLTKCVAAGAASTEALLMDVAETFGVRDVIATYGMTETCTGVTGSLADDTLEQRTQTVGAVWPGVEMRFESPVTHEILPMGQTGEMVVRGFNLMKGYYNMPQETAAVLSPDGWLRTGDLGYMRPDRHVCFVGRLKESIKKNGETISPMEVENVLQREPRIAASAVVGVPDERTDEEVAAFVRCKPGAVITPEEIREFCVKDIPRFKIPKYIFFTDTFPCSATGKILRSELKKMAEELVKKEA